MLVLSHMRISIFLLIIDARLKRLWAFRKLAGKHGSVNHFLHPLIPF